MRAPVALDKLAKPANPAAAIVIGFAALILVGALLLELPFASRTGQPTAFVDALFTSTSAVCVTGLTVVLTGTHWAPFGQAIVFALFQIGGFGFMTWSILLLRLMHRRISLSERLLLRESLGEAS
ncbi:MAG: Trk family potassium uptake protein, partial [Chloroflexota bacterium]|nr:Trk family potassium uptake protein [Chloroflexota bacterium]